jgi:glycosyltransferase involved in cell wall biosynthesis
MNIVMFTNTFAPHVGGVARSVAAFTAEYRRRGHRVLIVAPEFPDMPSDENEVIRIPAIQHFNGSDFSVALPGSGLLTDALDDFQPDLLHAHHPFLLGMAAVRIAGYRNLPLVFTHHTLYEQYTHYVPGDSPTLQRFVIELATRYANLSDQVFAPSESIGDLLRKRGVVSPIEIVPTGVDLAEFSHADGAAIRHARGIPDEAVVVGHVGRLAPEKNLEFLAESVALFAKTVDHAHFLVVGGGPSEGLIREIFARESLSERLHMIGIRSGQDLADALDAMDFFAFSSKSETQGMVLTEAMTAGLPVVAIDAPGAREVVRDLNNGRLLQDETSEAFASALQWLASRPEAQVQALKQSARDTAAAFSLPNTADKALSCYESLRSKRRDTSSSEYNEWENLLSLIKAEWSIIKSVTRAGDAAVNGEHEILEP